MGIITSTARAKGAVSLLKRACRIANRYGLTPTRMDRALHSFLQILRRFGCGASFPLTAVVLERNPDTVVRYLDQGVEFAVHGYTHVDYARLAPEEQLAHLRRACEAFVDAGITPVGFRAPYLRQDPHLYAAAEAIGFSYVSSQPVMWDVLEVDALTPLARTAYQRAIDFYAPWDTDERPSLPRCYDRVVEVPVSLPDDEILLDRLDGHAKGLVKSAWRRILSKSYQRGELFTVQLHPERIAECADGLSTVLAEARALSPPVWLARLDEIATWWRARAASSVEITDVDDGSIRLAIAGPSGTTVLIRGVDVDRPVTPWVNGYKCVVEEDRVTLTVHAPLRPFIGLSPDVSPNLVGFLCQQGYILEVSEESRHYAHYFDQTEFPDEHERSLLTHIERTDRPLVRLGCWPSGARSALAITGDIDALTLWDYGLRFLGS